MAYTTIDDPKSFFNTVLWTGNGADRTITTDHATDWIWMKDRDQAIYHRLTDSVRGAAKVLFTNETNAEQSDQYGTVGSFTSTGFTIRQGASNSNYVGANENNIKYVGWSWVGGGSASSNSNGSITSSVSANTTAGFSIVSFTGTGSNATVGHGLGVAPNLMLIKARSVGNTWGVYHSSTGNTGALFLDDTSAFSSSSTYWNNTSPTSSVFTISTNTKVNQSSATYIAYCLAEKKGYSKFGSYTGNGSTSGTYVHLGFKPSWIMVKRTDATDVWHIIDNKRDPFNKTADSKYLDPASSGAEYDNNRHDFFSTGFQLKASGTNSNASGGNYIFMAFAESPFVNSNGVPNNAR